MKNLKQKIFSILTAVSLCVSLTVPCTMAATSETTVIETVKALGIMVGDENGNMNLSALATRAQFVKMMVATSSYKDTVGAGYGASLFSDVKSDHWAGEFIKLAVDQSWVTGYVDGTFRPENNITLEEACSALLKMLGYDTSSLAGSFPTAQLSKASAIGLLDDVTATQGQTLTRQNCAMLFYNLLTAQTKDGAVYGTSLGYTITNGEVDYSTMVNTDMKGPYVSTDGQVSLPFSTSSATVYRNGSLSDLSAVKQYDVYYYNANMQTVWVYNDRVTGTLTGVSPDRSAPTAVTVSGVTYTIGTSSATYSLSSQGNFPDGTVVTLLLGMSGEVVEVLNALEDNGYYYGVIVSSQKVASTSSTTTADSTSLQIETQVACTSGEVRTFYHTSSSTFKVGQLVTATVNSSGTTVKSLSTARLSGTVDKNGTSLGGYTFADDIEILDTDSGGGYQKIYPARIASTKITESDVRYYTLNEKGEIDRLILNAVTGDTYSYALLTDSSSNDSSSSSSASYTYMQDGSKQTMSSSNVYSISNGGIAFIYDSGSLSRLSQLKSATLTDLTELYALAGNKKYLLDEDAQVLLYDRTSASYYGTTLSDINAEDYTLTGWYDDLGCAAGGRIRIIVATKTS
ncbi:MAG: S-layer homology domain-containing protein [Oscillospiraceae bacterium]|nr:S-layer homology domain-containing protein [Oscillospiraceae bacterium]